MSFSTKTDGSSNDYRQVQFLQQKQQQKNQQMRYDRKSRTAINLSTLYSLIKTRPHSYSEIDATSLTVGDGANVAKYDPHRSQKAANSEPKLPTSISNIGGVILRSKTADFERMSVKKQYKQQSQRSSFTAATTAVPSTEPESTVTTTTTTPHLYKRRELIPSAKRGSTKK